MGFFNPLPTTTFYRQTTYDLNKTVTDFFGAERSKITQEDLNKAMKKPGVTVDSDYFKALQNIFDHWDSIKNLSTDGNESENVITIADYEALVKQDGDKDYLAPEDFGTFQTNQKKLLYPPKILNKQREGIYPELEPVDDPRKLPPKDTIPEIHT